MLYIYVNFCIIFVDSRFALDPRKLISAKKRDLLGPETNGPNGRAAYGGGVKLLLKSAFSLSKVVSTILYLVSLKPSSLCSLSRDCPTVFRPLHHLFYLLPARPRSKTLNFFYSRPKKRLNNNMANDHRDI